MGYFCHNCGTDLSSEVERGKAGRSQTCPKCKRDLRVCLNCKHYDSSAHNQCRESSAGRVVDKERSNFCDYFSFSDSTSGAKTSSGKKDYLKDLDKLFK